MEKKNFTAPKFDIQDSNIIYIISLLNQKVIKL